MKVSFYDNRNEKKLFYDNVCILITASVRLTAYEEKDEFVNWIMKLQLEQKSEDQISIPVIKELDETMEPDDGDLATWLHKLKDEANDKMDFIIIVCGATSEQIHKKFATLYFNLENHSTPLYVLTRQHLHILLPPGDHIIHIPKSLRQNRCTLAPLHQLAIVTTTGLQEDLFKHCVSYQMSLRYKKYSTKVTIRTNSPLFWSMETHKSVGTFNY